MQQRKTQSPDLIHRAAISSRWIHTPALCGALLPVSYAWINNDPNTAQPLRGLSLLCPQSPFVPWLQVGSHEAEEAAGCREITNYKVRVNYWKNIYRTERKAAQAGFGKGQAGTGQGLGSRHQGSEGLWAGSGLFSGLGSLFTLTHRWLYCRALTQDSRGPVNADGGKLHFISTNPKLKFSISSNDKCSQQTTAVLAVPVTVTNRNQTFCITFHLQKFQDVMCSSLLCGYGHG